MGYQDVDVYKLNFGDHRSGLEVVAEGLTMRGFLDVVELTSQLPGEGEAFTAESRKVLRALIEQFAPYLMSWNVEDRDEEPVPATLDGLLSLKPGLVMDIVLAWVNVQQVSEDGDLGKDSASTGASGLEGSLTMAPLSPSPGS